ncbi:3-oxoacyl-ACP synthase [Streptomyces sp. AJS327]|uniref:3-oxoacyl-ACP synthase III family protein n=1 Tax=Streptomyces sp. AJS327 TaxID=2545265 RepID=UPI0015DFB038|nr:3-oxoacyl-[acyl-carrier-protein] synthase III C-terminal domain-containing protein [Streptomyces sp. AJS327]MBA0053321.1 3-oxoacyl-ACP synthase [Streptomyces sp. AJS327]
MKTVSLLEVASYLPPDQVPTSWFDQFQDGTGELSGHKMFEAPTYRHHVAREESAADMIEQAARTLLDRIGPDEARGIDLVLTNVLLPDLPFTGSGAEISHRLGLSPEWVIDAHNGGCASFVHLLRTAQALIGTGQARAALICNVQNVAGTVMTQEQVRGLPQAVVPGDGCGVAYVAASEESPVLGIEVRNLGEYSKDCGVTLADGRKYWEAGESQMRVDFTPGKVSEIVERGHRLVPEVVRSVCDRLDLTTHDLDRLVTNQPNRVFLRTWQEDLEVRPEDHLETYDRFGNLFGAAVPVNLDHGVREGRVPDGSLLMLAGFAHAGDFAGAAAVHWRRGTTH